MSSQNQNMVNILMDDSVIVMDGHIAVAIKYDETIDLAPIIVTKGVDEVALQIMTIGREKEVQIVHNPSLAHALYSSSDIGQFIPDALYAAVAEMFALVNKSKS